MKAYTDIEQSRKLAEILPIESADMSFVEKGNAKHTWYDAENKRITTAYEKKYYIPCWSLAALLDIFPCSKESPIVNLTRGGWNPSFTRRWFATWEDEDKNVFYSCNGTSPVDAVVELILKLHEQKLL